MNKPEGYIWVSQRLWENKTFRNLTPKEHVEFFEFVLLMDPIRGKLITEYVRFDNDGVDDDTE